MRFYGFIFITFVTAFVGVSWGPRGFPDAPTQQIVHQETELKARRATELKAHPDMPTFGGKSAKRGVERLKENEEQYALYGRSSRRKSAVDALSKSLSSFCDDRGREALVSSVGHYYYHRHNEVRSARETYGAEGEKFVRDLYKTPEDSQIEQLTRQTYANGYIQLTDFRPDSFERIALSEAVKEETVRGKGCVG